MFNLHIIWMPSVLFHFPCQGSSLTDRKEFEKSSCWATLLNEKPIISANNQVIWILWGKHCVSNKHLKFWFNILLKEFQFFRKTLYQKAEVWFSCGSSLSGVTSIEKKLYLNYLQISKKVQQTLIFLVRKRFLSPSRVEKITSFAGKKPLWEFIHLLGL